MPTVLQTKVGLTHGNHVIIASFVSVRIFAWCQHANDFPSVTYDLSSEIGNLSRRANNGKGLYRLIHFIIQPKQG
jgi:hypothetical protein